METLDSDARIPDFEKTFHRAFLFAACPEHETEKRSGQQVDVRTIGDNPVLRHLLMSPERHLPCGESQIQKAVSFQKGF